MPYDVNKYERYLEKKRIKKNKKGAKLAERRRNKCKKIYNFLKNNEGKAFTEKEINNKLSFWETFKCDDDWDSTHQLLNHLAFDSPYNIHMIVKTKYVLFLFCEYLEHSYYYGREIRET